MARNGGRRWLAALSVRLLRSQRANSAMRTVNRLPRLCIDADELCPDQTSSNPGQYLCGEVGMHCPIDAISSPDEAH